jgi:type VI secretion system secreted protein Hcp
MGFDAFCKIDGIKGESTDDKHKDQIEILSFSHGIHQPTSATASSVGGAAQGRSEHDDFTVTKYTDASTAKLLEACAKGQHIKDVTIELCRAGGDKLPYLEIKMEQVMISHVIPSGSSKGDDGFPTESVSFNYGTIKWTYTQQKRADGSGGGKITGGWDRTANKVAA